MHTHRNWPMHINNTHQCIHAWLPSAWQAKHRLTNVQVLCRRASTRVPTGARACAKVDPYSHLSRARAHPLLSLLHTVHLYAFYLPNHNDSRLCRDIWPAKPKPGSLSTYPHSCHVQHNREFTLTATQTHVAMPCQSLWKQDTRKLRDSEMMPRLPVSWPDSQWKNFQLFSLADWDAKDGTETSQHISCCDTAKRPSLPPNEIWIFCFVSNRINLSLPSCCLGGRLRSALVSQREERDNKEVEES